MRRMRRLLPVVPDLRVRVRRGREPRIAGEGRKLPDHLATPEWVYQLFPLPFHEACCFIDESARCTIYEGRPDVCRAFAAGGDQCQAARAVPACRCWSRSSRMPRMTQRSRRSCREMLHGSGRECSSSGGLGRAGWRGGPLGAAPAGPAPTPATPAASGARSPADPRLPGWLGTAPGGRRPQRSGRPMAGRLSPGGCAGWRRLRPQPPQ